MSELKQMLVVRKDLNMRKGKMCAQTAHASLKATLENMNHPAVLEWLSGRFTKIAVGVDSYEELMGVVENAQDVDLITAVIEDAGLTEFAGVVTVTCAAIGPAHSEELESITGHLKLL